MDNCIVLDCNKYGNNILNKVSQLMTQLSLWRRENGEQGRKRKEVAEISGGSVWSASTTPTLISYFKKNPILWDKRLNEYGNKAKTKKAMARLITRTEKALRGLHRT